NSFKIEKKINSEIKYFLRISNLENINDIDFQKFSAVFLKFQFHDLKFFLNNISNTVNCFSPYGAKHNNGFSPRGAKRNNLKSKIVIELPKFISELEIQNYKNILRQLSDNKFNVFSISHLSQIEILPQKSKIFSNENIYLLNDLSVNFAKNNGVSEYIYPYENDYPNLISGRDRNGIVPIYFYPELFFSRVPVKVGEELKDEEKNAYKKINFNGFTIIIDKNPVSLTHFSNKLIGKGFTKFLFDFSYKENYQEIENVLEFFKTAKRIQNSKEFNMKKCLK
ncbi:MAG: hypothetical protein LBV69_08230, partial [Bacteroidales bacterium]|nr:hypothetical protein [Bacteroidales bacterium]